MRRRRAAVLAAFAAGAVAAAAPAWAPPVLRHVPLFSVRRVEVTGTRLLAPHEALAAAGIAPGGNLFADPRPWVAALRRHPAVAGAEVTVRLPGTLRVRVREKEPAAFVLAGTLRPATADGEILPVDPARVRVDLPLLRATVGGDTAGPVRAPAVRAALAEAGRLAQLDPGLMARTSELRPDAGGGLRLTLAEPRAEVVLPPQVDDARLARLRAALHDVARREPEGRPVLDARFEDQVVVRPGGAR